MLFVSQDMIVISHNCGHLFVFFAQHGHQEKEREFFATGIFRRAIKENLLSGIFYEHKLSLTDN